MLPGTLARVRSAIISKGPSLQQVRAASCITDALQNLAEDTPLKDAVRFRTHQIIWTRQELKRQVDALATGFQQFSCKPGTTIAIWLPEYVEKVAVQLAAAVAGVRLVIVDNSLNKVEDFDKVMLETQPKIVIVHEKFDNSLKAAIPEMEFFALHHDHTGRPFRSRRFTNLRYCAHVSRDVEEGIIQFSQLLTYDVDVSPLPKMIAAVNDDTPLSITYSAVNGKPQAGPELSHKDALEKDPAWASVRQILNKEFIELGGLRPPHIY